MAVPGLRVLISAPYLISEFERFGSLFRQAGIEPEVAQVIERLSADQLQPFAGQVDGVVCGDDEFSAEVLQAFAPRLKVISKWGTGVDSIDRGAAQDLGIHVANTPDAFTEPVSDSVIGYMLAFCRGIPWLDDGMKRGEWAKRRGWALRERSLGVIGVGRIGKAVLRKASTFGMQLYGNDVVEIPKTFLNEIPVRMVELNELLRSSDFVSLNCDLNSTSHHLINSETLAEMRAGSVLVNTSRGPVVDEQALISALQQGRLGGAALDVFENEPLALDSPLRSMDNVLLAPHNSNASEAAWERVHWNTIKNLLVGLGLQVPPDVEARAAPSHLEVVKK